MVKISHQTVYICDPSASCGCSTNPATVSRIVGGENASSSTWGWAISLYINNIFRCGGSIISNSWIVTAAHCADKWLASNFTVYAGSTIVNDSTQIRNVSRVVVHPGYNPDTNENDIALLQLSTPLSMSDSHVSQICLPSVSSAILEAVEWPPANTVVVAVGWGRLSFYGALPLTLQQVSVQTVDYQDWTCNTTIQNWHLQLCAGVSGGGKDTCQGDSGGPLMMFSSNNQWILIGVTSYGEGCALPDEAGVYTRVAVYTNWINSYIHDAVSTSVSSNPTTISSSLQTTVLTLTSSNSVTTSSSLQTTVSTISPTITYSDGNTISSSMFNIFVFALLNWLIVFFNSPTI